MARLDVKPAMKYWKASPRLGLALAGLLSTCLFAVGTMADEVTDEVSFASGLIGMGFPDLAETVLEQLQERYPDRVEDTKLIRAELAMAYRRFEEAEKLVGEIPANRDKGRAIRLKLGTFFYGADQVNKARALYEEFFDQFDAVHTDPEMYETYEKASLHLAVILENAGQYEAAAGSLGRIFAGNLDSEDLRMYKEKQVILWIRAAEGKEGVAEEKKRLLDKAAGQIRDIEFGGPFWVVRATILRAKILLAEDKFDEALAILKRQYRIFKQIEVSYQEERISIPEFSPKSGYHYVRGLVYQERGFDAARNAQRRHPDALVVDVPNSLELFVGGLETLNEVEKLAARKIIGKAVGCYTKVLKDYGTGEHATHARLRLAECMDAVRRLGGTIKLTVDLKPTKPLDADEMFRIADTFYRNKKHREASDAYLKVLNQFPKTSATPRVLTNLGKSFFHRGHTLDAQATMMYMAEQFSGDGEVAKGILKLATFFRKQSAPVLSDRAYLEFVEHFPGHPKAPRVLYVLAQLAKEKSNETEEARLMDLLVDRYPDSEYYLKALWVGGATAYEREQFDAAKMKFALYGDQAPEGNQKANAMMLAAECDFRQERYADAFKGFQKVVKALDPGLAGNPYYVQSEENGENEFLYQQAFFKQAYCLSKIEEPVENVSDFRADAINLFDEFARRFKTGELAPTALAAKGAVYLQMDRYDDATTTFEHLSETFPDTPEGQNSLYTLVDAAMKVGKADIAMESVDKMVANPEAYEPLMFARVGQLMLANGLHDQAIRAYEIMLDSTEDSGLRERGYYGLGTSYHAKGDCGKAIENIEELIELNEKTGYFFEASMVLAKACRMCEQYDDALQALTAIYEQDKDAGRRKKAEFELALVQLAQGRKDAAFASYLRLSLYPDPLRDPVFSDLYRVGTLRCLDLAMELKDWDAVLLMAERMKQFWPEDNRIGAVNNFRDDALLEKAREASLPRELAPGQ